MLKMEEITKNINTEWQISLEKQKEIRYGLGRYITDICTQMELNPDTASIAMIYTHYFFIKKSYFNYDKYTIACAAILLACKYENIQGKLHDISRNYIKTHYKILGKIPPSIKLEDIQKIKDNICAAETRILKSLNFDLYVNLPNYFIGVYSAILYPDNDDVYSYAMKISYESFYTYANLIFKPYCVAISCIILSAKTLNLPSVMDSNFAHINNMKVFFFPPSSEDEFNRKLLSFENKSLETNETGKSYFDIYEWNKKLHPFLEIKDLYECLNMIIEYYDDMKNFAIKNCE